MADHRERKIPVFSVWKNNVILKNIFLINSPPSLDEIERRPEDLDSENGKTHQEFEETLMVGRHPDCDIRLEHPSISRFHLRIHSLPSSTLLFLTDLSSVHGTWVSGKRIEPNVRTRLNESDTLRIGGSSRIYKLHWIPLSQAYDMEHPFVPPLDFPEPHEDEEEDIIKDEICPESQNEDVHLVCSVSNGLESPVLRENDESVVDKAVTEGLPLHQDNTATVTIEDVELAKPYLEGLGSLFGNENSDVFAQKEIAQAAQMQNDNAQVLVNKDSGSESLFQDENSEACVQKEIQMQTGKPLLLSNNDSGSESLFQDENSETGAQKEIQMQNEDSGALENGVELLFEDKNSGSESLSQDENSEACVQKDIQMQNENPSIRSNNDSGSESLFQCENSETGVQTEIQMQNEDPSVLENGVELLFEEKNSEVYVQKEIPSPPQMQYEHSEVLQNDGGQAVDSALDGLVPLLMGENWEWVGQQNHLACPAKEYNPPPFEHEDEGFFSFDSGSLDDSFLDETSKLLANEYIPSAPPKAESMAFHLAPKLDSTLADKARGSVFSAEMILENEKQSPLHEDAQDDAWNFWYGSLSEPFSPMKEVLSDVQNKNLEKENQCIQHEPEPRALSERRCLERVDMKDDKECSDSELWSFWSGNMGVESVCSSLSDAEAFSVSENRLLRDGYKSPQPPSSSKKLFGSPLLTSELKSACSIWSRRGKHESAPQILTSRTKGENIKTDQENLKDESISRVLFRSVDDQEEDEIFTPDKENFTPNTHRSMRKMAVLKEARLLNSAKSSLRKMIGSPDVYYEDGMSPASDKENYSPKVLQEQKTVKCTLVNQLQALKLKERKEERVPFQPLLAESPQKSISETCIPDAAIRTGKSVNSVKATTKAGLQDKSIGERTRKWNMVVDTTTLLNKESRKALQLLAGLKGTQLIIPKIVIRELDSLKRQVSFFRKNTEVFSALEWIQHCMAKTQWWIHVESSMEEGRPVAPTPPASPHSHFSFGTASSFPFSTFESWWELQSPTTEDHVLDYALCFRTQNDGQLVLLSNDVSLKIKAIAEGLICEGAEEFRESLVNPFSERFLWADSSPRGQTWSCSDDIVMREKFYPSSLKMTPKAMENAKGLKLILLHNSQYFERMTALR